MYYIYVLRCSDNSLYTGITTDVKRRVAEHYYQKKQCAKYTKSRKVISLEAVWSVEDKSSALKYERRIKSMTKCKKEQFIQKNDFENCVRIGNITLEDCIVQSENDK